MQSGHCYIDWVWEHYVYYYDEEAHRYFMRLKGNFLFTAETDPDDIYPEGLPDRGHWSC